MCTGNIPNLICTALIRIHVRTPTWEICVVCDSGGSKCESPHLSHGSRHYDDIIKDHHFSPSAQGLRGSKCKVLCSPTRFFGWIFQQGSKHMSGTIYVTIENAGDMAIAMNLSFVPVRSLGSGLLQSPTQDHGMEAWIVPANCSVSELNLLTICLFQQDSIQKKGKFSHVKQRFRHWLRQSLDVLRKWWNKFCIRLEAC